MKSESYAMSRPENWRGGVIVASPHSGRDYPEWFIAESAIGLRQLRSSEDAFMDLIASPAARLGAATLCATMPRALVDLNRARSELDPDAIESVAGERVSLRVRAGLGVIPRVVANGVAIRAAKLTRAEADSRIARYWRPYHAALSGLIDEARARFGQAVVIDMHSMPHLAIARQIPPLPEVVMGDLNGRSCGEAVSATICAALAASGFRSQRNLPFAGAYIAANYGRPKQGVHVVQLEFDRSLYMDEATIAPHDGFDGFAARVETLLAHVIAALDPESHAQAAQ